MAFRNAKLRNTGVVVCIGFDDHILLYLLGKCLMKFYRDGKDSIRDKDGSVGKDRGLQDVLDRAVRRSSNQSLTRWLIKVVSYKTSKGIHTVEFLCVNPQPDGNATSYAVINPGKQYYNQTIVPEKRYYFVNPRPIIQQEINKKKVYYVDKIEEAV